ncbi:major facilitator superfamily domain-containing protein [Xylariales sp. PMI_506]|nr:major facilitator superfamily domain-containing protein [Xylariales sp. PMI_506]
MAEKGEVIDTDVSADSRDLDDAYELYKKEDVRNIDPEEEKRVRRKIDRHILPLMCVSYMLQYLDKTSTSFASVFGLQAGTGLVGQDYAWLSSIFYFGYLIAQYPAGYLLQRLPTAKFIGGSAIVWGILMITTPACKSFAGIAVNRFILGMAESVINPGFVLIISMFYKQSEQPLRLLTYYSFNGWAGIIGGLLGYAMGHITSGLAQWMYVFLVFGSLSIVWGVIFILFMPDLPSSARFLNERERIVAVERVAANRQGVKNHHFKAYQVRQTLRDPKTWILFFMAISAQIPNSAQSSFQSIVLQSFGFNSLQTQVWQIPGSAVQVMSLYLSGYICSRWPNVRFIVITIANLICIVSAGLLVGISPGPSGTDHKWSRLVALWLGDFISVGFSLSLTMVSSNIAGYTKKQLTGAFVFVGYCIGNIISPQTFIAKQAPYYHSAYVAMLVGFTLKTVFLLVLYAYMWSANKKRDREAAAAGTLESEAEVREAIEKGMLDVTELDNKGFRYAL